MAIYVPPAASDVDFDLVAYSVPAANEVDFELNPVSSNTSNFFFLWYQ